MGKKDDTKGIINWIFPRINIYSIIAMAFCILINLLGHFISDQINLPIWIDTIGTMVIAIQFGPLFGALIGAGSVLLMSVLGLSCYNYYLVGMTVGVLIGLFYLRKKKDTLAIISAGMITGILSSVISVPLDFYNYGTGKIGNDWGNAFYDLLSTTLNSKIINSFGAELFVNLPDKVLTLLFAITVVKMVESKNPENRSNRKTISIILILAIILGMFGSPDIKVEASDFDAEYETVQFGSEDGLMAKQINAIVQTNDGYMWVGTYSGLYQYDGIKFKETGIDERIRNVMVLYADSRGKLWIGTNDMGVFCYDTETMKAEYYGTENGLTADSIRCISEDTEGNIYIGTVRYITKISPEGNMKTYSEWEDVFYPISLAAMDDGSMVGVTNGGTLFKIKDDMLQATDVDESGEGTTYRAVVFTGEKLYAGTSGSSIFELEINGEDVEQVSRIKLNGLSYINKMVYNPELEGLLVCGESGMGYVELETKKLTNLAKENYDGAVSDVCVDEQGNIWFVSNKNGILKYSRSPFKNILNRSKVNTGVVNALLISDNKLFIGTDSGIEIIDLSDHKRITETYAGHFLKARVRNIMKDSKGNIWFSTYGDNGLIRLDKDKKIKYFNEITVGMLGSQCRSVIELSDGRILVASNMGLSYIDGDTVVKTIGVENGLKNQYILSLYEREDGTILAASDGDGIYLIKNDKVVGHIGKAEGLDTSVVLRIVKCTDGYLYVTSNALYYDNGKEIRKLEHFPYSNNYDVMISDDGNCWITSSAGLYVVNEAQLLQDGDYTYTLLNDSWGLRTSFTANSWNVMNGDDLYLCCIDGVRVISTKDYDNVAADYELHLKYISSNSGIITNNNGVFVIPPKGGRIEFNVAINNYTLSNPLIHYYLEGTNDPGITCYQSEVVPLSYTNLPYGHYKFHIEILDSSTGHILEQKVYTVEKQAMKYERLYFKIYLFTLGTLLVMYLVWLFYAINKKTKSLIGLQREIVTDPMTGIYNKAGSHKVLKTLCAEETGFLLMIDLDSFKLVNDIYGHDMGDKILIRFAELVQEAVGEDNMAGRIGGDEFIGFIKNTESEDEVDRITKYLNKEIVKSAKEYMGDDMNIPLGSSIGAVRCPADGTDFEELFKLADKALYVVKQRGKHNYSIYQKKSIEAESATHDNNSLEQIKKIIGERNEGKGAYSVSFDKLQTIYKYINRADRINSSKTGFIRFRITSKKGSKVTDDVMERLEEHLTVRLKKNDVISRLGGDIYVLCTNCDEEDCHEIVKRMTDSWESIEENKNYEIKSEVETVI